MGRSGVVREQVLPPHASSAAEARALIREALESAAADELADTAQLAVSEVVTNALVHAGTPVHLQVRVDDTGLRVEVGDGNPHLPARRDYSLSSGTGRGLHLVSGLVDDWGSFSHGDGKVVWFEMRPTSAAAGDHEARPQESSTRDSDDTVEVELLKFPLLMHLAWQEHASSLLREFLLTILDADELRALERHAEASDAMNVLFEQVPLPELGEDPAAIMSLATEPEVTAVRLTLRVPRASATNFDTLDEMLDEASSVSAAGGLLMPTTQPEITAMRTWICRQVREQSTGASAPTPWSAPTSSASTVTVAPGWDPAEVAESPRALLATDELSLIVAVSPSAAALLGYQDGDLEGHPIIRIVPARYQQAHIAGTTLHMVNGRGPLLGKKVTVPVVTGDGSEKPVTLVVEPRPLGNGHRVFVAEFFPQAA